MALEIILNLVPTVLEYTVGPLIRHAGYAFCYARRVAELKNQVEKLATTRESLQNSVQAAISRGDEIQPNVEKWLTDAENAIKEAGELTQREEEEAKKKCFSGGIPNLRTRCRLGKQATKETLAIQALENEGKFDASQISYRAPPQQIVSSSAHGFEDLPSRASIFKDVMDALSDPIVNMIGVYGLGGTGKTTLAREVHKQVIEGKLFDVVAMATVSQKPDLKEIQGSIADVLGLRLEEETVDGRASRLHQRLMKEKKVLIILDNLLEKIELEQLGIPLTNEKCVRGRGADSVREGSQFNSQLKPIEQEEKKTIEEEEKGCKVIMTSRNGRLLTDEMGVQKDFKLDLMTEEESWTLFERTVGDLKNPRLRSIAIEVAKKCGGLPILSVTVASALRNKEVEIWKDALKRLSTFQDEEIQEKVSSAIEFSYDHLPGEEVKSFFLLCGLFTYANIPILDLLKYSMGLGLLKHIESVEDARNRIQKLLTDLKASCLLSESDMDGCVKIHDIVQGIAASIASRTQLGFKKVGASLEEFQRMDITSYTKIFLDYCDVSILSLKSQCPAVEFFRLSPKDLSLKIPDSFFEGITKLQVLDFKRMCFSSLPLSLGSVTSLHTLCLDFCKLEDISVIRQLKNLEILSLMSSDIVELPRDLGQLNRLKFLGLRNCYKLKFIPKNLLSQLSLLEELLMGNSFVSWEAKHSDNQSNASLSELEHLPLTNLEIHVPDAKKLPKRLSSKKLERYIIFIGKEWGWCGKYQTSRTLKLKLDTSIHSNHGLKTLLEEVEDLYLDDVKGITNVLYDLHSEGFPQLKHLHVQNGGEIRHIIDSKRWVSCDAFPALESLTLHNLLNLDKISQGKLLSGDFCRLKILKIRSCNKLKNLFKFSTVRRNLQQLGEMEIIDCSDMEVLFVDENEEEEDDDKNDVVEFTQLYSLKLQLPLLRSFCSKGKVSPTSTTMSHSRQKQSAMDPPSYTSVPLFNEMIVFPNLKELKLSSIGVDKIWNYQFVDQSSFCKLTSLTVETCWNLNYLFTSSIIKSLAKLKKLEICDCKLMEEVITTGGETIGMTPFPNLENLKLKGLPNLSKFCIGNFIEFPCLKGLWIEDCLKLKAFISNLVAINTRSSLALFDEKVAFPQLEALSIINMEGLKMIWHNELHESSFHKLKSLVVEHAEELLSIFPSNMLMSRLLNLENLQLNDCALLEEVFNLQLRALISSRTQGFPASQLKQLIIQNLPNLKHIWNKLPQEREVIRFNDLQVMYAYQCSNLKRVFPAYIAMGLMQLKSLDIANCGIEEIVERDDKTEANARFEFPKLVTLRLYNLPKLKALYSGMHISEWPMLKTLDVHDCGGMKMFASESGSFDEISQGSQLETPLQQPFFSVEKVITNLEELTLNCKDAQMIWDAQSPAHLFDKVMFLHLQLLDQKSATFVFALLRRFRNLEILQVINNGLQELFSCAELVDEKNQGKTVSRVRHLSLKFLYNLKSIWRRDCQGEPIFENLETLEVFWCMSLISLAPSIASFANLSHLDVWKCEGLLNLVTSSTAQYLGHLTRLSVTECNILKEIVAREEDYDGEDQMITWGKLKSLKLCLLGSLTCFSSAYHTFQFPSLEEVIVTGCPKMKAFSAGVLVTPNLKRVKLVKGDAKVRWEGDLNTTIQQLCSELVGLQGIGHLQLSNFPELKETWYKEHFPANFLSYLRSLVVDECVNTLSCAVPSNLLRFLNNLLELEVKNCDSVEEVFDLTQPNATDGHIWTLPKLNKLQLIDLPRLKRVWKEEPKGLFYQTNIKVLKIHNCSALRYLFTPITCLGLVRLRELELKGCPLIEEIIIKGAASKVTVDSVMLPVLNSISLECLPKLTSFYSGGGNVQCPSLKSIAIIECSSTFTFTFLNERPPFNTTGVTRAKIIFPNLKELKLSLIGMDKIWHNHFADQPSFYKLTSLTVDACQNLHYLFTSSMVNCLAQLQKLEISNCDSMEDVIATEGEIISRAPFPNLEFLKLEGLPNLTTFYIGDFIEFPNLKELWIDNCARLMTFISPPVAVNAGSNLALFDEKVAFPKLEELRIVKMDGLKMIWHSELSECSFLKLKSMIVEHAQELLSIFPSDALMSRFLDLESLELIHCASLEEVFNLQLEALVNMRTEGPTACRLRTLSLKNLPKLKHTWNKHPQEREVISFNDLQIVEVGECPNLRSVFPAYIARGLLQLEELELYDCGIEEIIERNEETEAIAKFEFPKLTTLTLYNLSQLERLYPGMHTSEWPRLKSLDVHDCDKMKIFFTSESGSSQESNLRSQFDNSPQQPFFSVEKVIPNLEELTLTSNDAQMMLDAQLPTHLFDKVSFLHLESFDEKSASFLLALLSRFRSLEKLEVVNNELKELFPCAEDQGRAVPKIRHMTLNVLHDLKSIWKQECQLEEAFKDLEILEVCNCDSLISLAPSVASFGNLSHLDVQKCQGLLNLLTSSTAQCVRHLTTLSIGECNMVEEIVAREEDHDREDQTITWANLKTLKLHCLGSLTCFSTANHTFKFPALEEVIVTRCPMMKAFSGGFSITPELKRVKLAEGDAKGRWEGDLNTTVQQLCVELAGLHGIEHLKLSDFPELKETWHMENFPANVLSKLRSLVVDECVHCSNVVPPHLLRSLDNLQELEVKNCDSVEEVFDLTLSNPVDGQIGTLPKLNELRLIDLPRLKQVWKEEPKGVFHLKNLKVLKIHSCSTLRYLFTPSMCLGLVRLQEVEVKSCPLIEEIITKGAASGATVDNVVLPPLKSVSFEHLPNLTSFFSGGGTVDCPSLKSIAIIECSSSFTFAFLNEHPPFDANGVSRAKIIFPNLKELKLSLIGMDKIWHDHFADQPSFYKLTSLTVDACQNLHYLFTSSMVNCLAQLQKLEISNCDSMEDVIATEGEIINRAPFPNLEFLKLEGLPNLSAFYIGDFIEFPNLKELWIDDCGRLMAFISPPVVVNAGSNLALFDEKASFPTLEELQIVNMDGIHMIWHNELHKSSFCKLKTVIVKGAGELQNIFPSNMLLSRLLNLENLELNDCALLEEVFNLQLQALINSRTQGMAYSRLKTLRIQNLPNLKHIWNKHPQERELISFKDLQVVSVCQCPNLKRVFPAFIARGLLQLESLVLSLCGIEEIVERDKETEAIARFEFPKLTTATLYNLRKLKTLYSGMHISEWPMLKKLDVHDCGEMEIFTSESESVQESSWGKQPENSFHQPFFSVEKVIPNLEELTLNSKDVQMIHDSEFLADLFDNVRFLHLQLLDKKSTSSLFAFLRRFRSLRNLEMNNNELQELFSCEELIDEEENRVGRMVTRIQHLRLRFLYNLKSIWKQDCQLEHMFVDLETLEVWWCKSLISLAPSVASFGNLSHLDVWKCEGLLNLVTSSTAKYMGHLNKLSIRECDMVEEIVAREEEDHPDDGEEQMMITWADLETLKLDRLESLTCFSSANHTFKFPSLKEVIVTQCPKMMTFSRLVPITPKLKRVKRTKEEEGSDKGRWEGDLNTTIHQLCAELARDEDEEDEDDEEEEEEDEDDEEKDNEDDEEEEEEDDENEEDDDDKRR